MWVINDNFKSFVKTFGFIARLAILYYILDLKMFCSHKRNNISLAQAGAEDVKRHKWFKGVDWEDVYYRFVTFLIIIIYKLHFHHRHHGSKG